MTRKSVTIFLPTLAGGGAERCMAIVASALAAQGTDVTMALAKAEGPFLPDLHPSVRVRDLRAASAWSALPGLVAHLRSARPAVLLSAMNHANVVAALAHKAAGSHARLVLSERAHLSSLLAEFPGLRMRITRALMRLTYPWADAVVAVSDGGAQDLRQHVAVSADRILTIYNPVVDKRLRELRDLPPEHPWLASGEVPVVLAAGRLTAQKDFSTLLDAFAQLRSKRQLRLVILGEGDLRAPLLAYAQRLGIGNDVSLPGFASNPFAAMRAARVFVLSSRFEGLPGALIQAMACGTPVISTDCPSGPREVLEAGRWGPLVPVGDAAALAEAVGEVLDRQQTVDVRVRAEDFTEDRAVAQYAKVLGLV
jgi:glycosyltransferase involved in cell wall biosynthesis